jgi:hypothetical protein
VDLSLQPSSHHEHRAQASAPPLHPVEIAILPAPDEDRGPRHPTRRRLVVAGVIAAGLVAVGGLGLDLARRLDAPGAPVFVTDAVARGPLHGVLPLDGRVEPAATAAIYAPAAGRVGGVAGGPRRAVARGQPVARLHPARRGRRWRAPRRTRWPRRPPPTPRRSITGS